MWWLLLARAVERRVREKMGEDVWEMALCESRSLTLRIGQAYRFVPVAGCATCERMKREHDEAYGPPSGAGGKR